VIIVTNVLVPSIKGGITFDQMSDYKVPKVELCSKRYLVIETYEH
jgi:hypothetical protein